MATVAAAAAVASQLQASHAEGAPDLRQVLAPALLHFTPGSHTAGLQAQTPSPASTEYLLSHAFGDRAFSPAGPVAPAYTDSFPQSPLTQNTQLLMEDLFLKFSTLLEKGLDATATKITGEIKADLQNIGSRMDATEGKLDQTAAVSHQNADLIQTLQDQLDTAFSQIDDLEN